jgi:peptidoglycan-associated lipoprotein
MFEPFGKTVISRFILAAAAATASGAAYAQALPAASRPGVALQAAPVATSPYPTGHEVQLSVTYEAAGANLTYNLPNTFFMQGAEAEVHVHIKQGFGVAGSFSETRSGNSGQGIPVNLVVFTVGPRYTSPKFGAKHAVTVFGQGLIGGANGFDGLYPEASGASPSATSHAFQTGGGIDVDCTRRISIRVLQVDWLRTGLPNATNNVQNTLRLGIGVVFRNKAR